MKNIKITKKLLFLLLCIASVSASHAMNEPGTMPNKFEFYSSPNIPLGKNNPKISKSKLKPLSKVKNPYSYYPLSCKIPTLVGMMGLLPMIGFFALGTGWFLLKSYRAS